MSTEGVAPEEREGTAGRADTVVELEFAIGDSDFVLVAATDAVECELELEAVVPRSDGTVLEYLRVKGPDPSRLQEFFEDAPAISNPRMVDRSSEHEALFELVSESEVASTLADEGTIFKSVRATSGRGTLTAEVPPHVDVEAVVDAFLSEYPGADLRAKRTTERTAPAVSRTQFTAELENSMTEKQLQALRVAHVNGYFEWPRERTADEVAAVLGVSTPTFSQHLRKAQATLLDALFNE